VRETPKPPVALDRDSRRSGVLLAGLIALASFLVYLPALDHDFVRWDDHVYLYENPNLSSIDPEFVAWAIGTFHHGNWHPVTWLSYGLDYGLWSLDPTGYHLTNALLHGLVTLLVVGLVGRLFTLALGTLDSRVLLASGLVGLLFGLHPLHVESVAWVSERKDVLYAFFWLLAIFSYLGYATSRSPRRRATSYGLTLVFFLLSLASKPMAVTLPAVLLILDHYPLKRLTRISLYRVAVHEKWPFYALGLGASVLTILAQRHGQSLVALEALSLGQRLWLAVSAIGFYLGKLLVPVDLAPYYPLPASYSPLSPRFLGSALLILAVSVLALRFARRTPLLIASWTYFLVTLLPILGLVQVGAQAAADRYTYLPMLGPLVLLGGCAVWSLGRETRWRRGLAWWMGAATLLAALGCAILTGKQIQVWKDSLALWTHGIQKFPESPKPYLERGYVLEHSGAYEAAIRDYRRSIEVAPRYLPAYNNLGTVYARLGDYRKAIEYFGNAISIDPKQSKPYYNRAQMYRQIGEPEPALEDFRQAARLGHPKARKLLSQSGIEW
jgi:tetratricopeptide (TPR) repeat protein